MQITMDFYKMVNMQHIVYVSFMASTTTLTRESTVLELGQSLKKGLCLALRDICTGIYSPISLSETFIRH